MISLLVGFLTFVLVLTCLLLILLILIQLPKKEAGAGVAFGGGATDALFGAGSGNALTKLTKYAATFFVIMTLGLSFLNTFRAQEGNRRLEEELKKKASVPQAAGLPAPSNPGTPITSTQSFQSTPLAEATNALKTTGTNQAAPSTIVTSTVPVQRTTNPAPAPATTTTGTPPSTVVPASTSSPAPATNVPAKVAPASTNTPVAPPK
jgi:protein translocase SecG subunit